MAQAAATAVGSPGAVAPRTRLLLEGPVVATLLRLAAPNVLVMALQAAVSTLDAVYVGWLGAPALAGVSLVFPLVMLMQTMSAGGMGGGVSSAIARALGAGRRAEANALAAQAILIAFGMALLFTASLLAGGPRLYAAMGGTGAVLEAAIAYSNVVFGGALAYWLMNTLANVVRGTGVMSVPAGVMTVASVLYLVLAPALVMGWGPFPRLGVTGAAAASVTAFGLGSLAVFAYIMSGRCLVRPAWTDFSPHRGRLREILRVGAPGSLNTIFTNLTVVVLTGLVGRFGPAALAGYGMGARLEYLQIPLVFGFGSALVAMVGTNMGAGQRARAERIAWTGAAMAAAVTGTIGLLGALFPGAWMGLFTDDAGIVATGAAYLRIVGPAYGFFGLGLALYFASQGAGRLMWPLLAGALRLTVAAAGGVVAITWLGSGLNGIFVAMALALVVLGSTVALAIKAGAWRGAASSRR